MFSYQGGEENAAIFRTMIMKIDAVNCYLSTLFTEITSSAHMARVSLFSLLLLVTGSDAFGVYAARPAFSTRVAASAPVMAVSKGELVDAIAAKAGISKKLAASVLTSTLDVIVESVANGDKVSLVGFGTFDSKERAAREGRNPQTGDKMQIAATVVPTFSFGKSFKDACKKSFSESPQVSQLNGHEAPN